MKAYITAKEYRRVFFDYGSINKIPDKVLVEVDPAIAQEDKCFCGDGECPIYKEVKESIKKI